MLMENGMGCCCQKDDALFWKNRHNDAMSRLIQSRQENFELKKQLAGAKAQCENTVENRRKISEFSQEVIDLREETFDLQKQLYAAKKEIDDFIAMYDKAAAEAHQAKVAKDRMGYSNRCMQSKIAKQAAEIKRLTEENKKLRDHNAKISNMINQLNNNAAKEEILYHDLWLEKDSLKKALDIAAKDADANFERGKIKGMEEIWTSLQWVKDRIEAGYQLMPVYGYYSMADCVNSLTSTAFLRKTKEWQEKEACNIKLGDEVEIFDKFDHDLSDIGIVIAIDKDNPCFAVIGPNFEGCFDETDIQNGSVKKTGRHFDTIPLDYLA